MTQGQKYQEYKKLLEKNRLVVYSCSTIEQYMAAKKYIKYSTNYLLNIFYPDDGSLSTSFKRYDFKSTIISNDFKTLAVLCKVKIKNLKNKK